MMMIFYVCIFAIAIELQSLMENKVVTRDAIRPDVWEGTWCFISKFAIMPPKILIFFS